MDPISHFRSLDDLIRTLDRERKLLMALFQDRKRLSFRRDIARDLASRKDESLDYLRRFGVIRDNGDFRIHCMMDEIGKLHPQNVKGILDFANARNILLINSSPTTYNVSDYRYTYLLSKDGKSQTVVHPLISQKETITDITDK